MSENYVAVARLKMASRTDEQSEEWIERGEEVSESEVNNFDLLVQSGSIVTEDRYKAMFPEVQEGSNQAWGSPSNLEQVEGSVLQMNPPEEGDEVPETRVPLANPADVTPVDGAKAPGDDTSDIDEDDLDDDDSDSDGFPS
jgi:hypothetical protein